VLKKWFLLFLSIVFQVHANGLSRELFKMHDLTSLLWGKLTEQVFFLIELILHFGVGDSYEKKYLLATTVLPLLAFISLHMIQNWLIILIIILHNFLFQCCKLSSMLNIPRLTGPPRAPPLDVSQTSALCGNTDLRNTRSTTLTLVSSHSVCWCLWQNWISRKTELIIL